MTPSTEQLTRLAHMSSIAKYTTGDNREFHHAMIDNGWIPECTLFGIRKWRVTSPNSQWDYSAAQNYYSKNGTAPTPPPF